MSLPSNDLTAAIAATRFGLGGRPGELARLSHDPKGWLIEQIRPDAVIQPLNPVGLPFTDSTARIMDYFAFKQAEKAAGDDQEKRKAAGAMFRAAEPVELFGRANVAITTEQPFAERWALFWSNHFTVSRRKGGEMGALAAGFEREALRPHVFGRFEDLLIASSRHPGMMVYLDQPQSIGPNSQAGLRRTSGLNENLAREIMELHSLGADAGYTQADVTEFARALTGWSVGRPGQGVERAGRFMYRPNVHEPGERVIFGRRYADAGESQALQALVDFAASPKTASHIATKLAIHFVSDQPDTKLVRKLSDAFQRSGGDLSAVARALVTANEAWSPEAAKIKTPYELIVSAYRALGQSPADYRREIAGPLNALGQPILAAPQPNGWSERGADWSAPDALIKRLQWAQGFAAYYAPQGDPTTLAADVLGARLRDQTLTALRRAESRKEALALLIMSPEFQRR